MGEWEVVPDEKPASESEWSVVPDGEPAPQPKSFLDKAKDVASSAAGKVGDSFSNFASTIGSAAKEGLNLVSPVTPEGGLHVPFSQLTDPAYRHELERGVSNATTAGLATKVANAIDPGFAEKEPAEREAAPGARNLGQVGGSFLPSPFTKLAEVGGIIPGTGPLASAARGVAGYEASAIPQAAIMAPEGHRLEAAKEAALDPAGLAVSGGLPAVTSFLNKRLDVARAKAPEIQQAAKDRAVNDIASEITGSGGMSSRFTDKQKVAEVKGALYDLADKNPELRHAFNEPAKKAVPKIQEWKHKIAEPLGRLDAALDQSTDGGMDPVWAVGKLRQMAKDAITPGIADAPVGGIGDSERLNHLADQFEKIYITDRGTVPENASREAIKQHGIGESPEWTAEQWEEAQREWNGQKGHKTVGEKTNPGGKGENLPEFSPEQLHAQLESLYDAQKNAKGPAAKAIADQIAKVEGEAKTVMAPVAKTSPAQGYKIPTRTFRNEVTALLKKTDSSYGAIEGSVRHQMLAKLYDSAKKIIDEHIDSSSIPAEQKAQIRDINSGYFLASRAEAAIESRGWKEANKPGFHFPTTVRQAVHGGGLAGIAGAAALGGAHGVVHALPYIAGTTLATHVLPKIAKTANWELAHGAYGRAVERLADLARKIPRAEFIGQAARAGLGQQNAQKIYDAAQKAKQAQPMEGDLTL